MLPHTAIAGAHRNAHSLLDHKPRSMRVEKKFRQGAEEGNSLATPIYPSPARVTIGRKV
jgi:hypothetical protein